MMLFFPERSTKRCPSPSQTSPDLADLSVTPANERLRPLLDAAANLDLEDREGWQRLRDASRGVIAALVADGQLPRHLAIDPNEPPVVVARTLVAAWRRTHLSPGPTKPSDLAPAGTRSDPRKGDMSTSSAAC